MRKHDVNYLIVGGFVAAMVVSALVLGALLAGRVGARDTYFTVLDNVADVGFGTQVRYEGFPVGQVEDIAPIAEGARMRFRVALSVSEGWRIPRDSIARIGSTSFLAAKTIDIESGRGESAIPTGGEIPSGAPRDMFAAMANVAAEVGDLSRLGLRPLVERMGDIVVRTGETLDGLTRTVGQRTPEFLDRLAGLITRLETSAAALQMVLSSRNAASVGRIIANAEETSQSLATTSGQLAKSMADIERMVASLDGVMDANSDNLDRSLKDAQHTLGAIARNIDTLVHNLDGAARNMNEFSRLIRQNPGLLLNGTPREEVSAPSGLEAGAVK
jgi:phospholipid/cholesterol/gamma-HCH transport system substrate-binding protein